ncbi:MAG: nucleotidyltransferase family protein [Actinomycetota bacterium]
MQALILAGGKATRMRPYTDERPKAMVEVAGTPIIEHQLRWLASQGVDRAVISCGYRHELIQDHLSDRAHQVAIVYAVEEEPLGRGGGLKFAARQLPDRAATFIALNGDIIAEFELAKMLELHRAEQAVATIGLAAFRTSWGVADLLGNLVRGFNQSPVLPYWINGGIYAFEPEVVSMLPDRGDHEESTFPALAEQGKLAGFRIPGYWRGIDTVKDVIEATRELADRAG